MDPQAPGADAAPAAEPAAAPVVTPAAEPAAPVVTPPAELTPEEKVDFANDGEWDEATDEIFPGLKTAKKKAEEGKKPDEPAKPAEAAKTPEAPAAGKDGDQPPKADGEGAAEGDEQDEDEGGEADPTRFSTSREARERRAEVEVLKADVKKQMFADVPTQLQDADGDPIRGIEDVMRLVNPRTGKAFTEEEAGMWLLSAQQQFNNKIADIERQTEQIAELHADLHDQVGSINYRYGELLKAMPEVRDRLWAQYQRTFVKDEKSGIIIKAPVSLEEFYETALEPYAEVARTAEAPAPAADPAKPAVPAETAEQKVAREAKEKADAEAKKKAERADRSDVFGGGDKGTADPEDDEWNEAAVTVFGPRKTN